MFSIIMPVFNGEKTIDRTIRGVLDQTYTNWELIIMDSESTDSSHSIIENYLSDPRIKYFREKDNGIYDGMNKGIDNAKGDWLYFTGCDDFFYDNLVLSKISEIVSSDDKLKVVYGKVVFQGSGKEYDKDFDLYRLSYKNICHQSIFFNKLLFDKLGYFNTENEVFADWEFNLKWVSLYKTLYIDQIIAFYNENGFSNIKEHPFLIMLPKLIKIELKNRDLITRCKFYKQLIIK